MKFERGYAQHLGSRQEQQDAGLVLADEGRGEQLVVVADGMGGHAGGSIASAMVAETAKRLWAEHLKAPMDAKRLLERIVREGHEAINKAGAEKGITPRSTCALLFLRDTQANWAHVGDSRIYRLRDGRLTRLTRDHSVVQMLVDLGKVSEEEMGTHPDQNRLTQSLGGEALPMPDFGGDAVKPHDAFLICSDGLWEMIPQAEMAAALAAKRLGDDGAKQLADRAFDRAKPKSDNITIALVRVGGPPPGAAAIAEAALPAADGDDARTTRMPPPARRTSGGALRWVFAAATFVGVAAAVVVIKPWETVPSASTGEGLRSPPTNAATPPAAPTPTPGQPPRGEQPRGEAPKPEPTPEPADRRAPPPPAQPVPPTPQPPESRPPPDQPPAQPPTPQPPPENRPPAPPPSDQPPATQPPAPPPPAPSPPPEARPPASPPPAAPPPPSDSAHPPSDGIPGPPETPSQPTPPGAVPEKPAVPDPTNKENDALENQPPAPPPHSQPQQPPPPSPGQPGPPPSQQ